MVKIVIIISILTIAIVDSVFMFAALKLASDFDDELERYYNKK